MALSDTLSEFSIAIKNDLIRLDYSREVESAAQKVIDLADDLRQDLDTPPMQRPAP
jgi:hypothetical protein